MKTFIVILALVLYANTFVKTLNIQLHKDRLQSFNSYQKIPNFQRYKRQAPLGEEITFFDKNKEVQSKRSTTKEIFPIREIINGAPEPPQKIRLRSDQISNINEGRVELYNANLKKWGIICDDYWNLPDANVTCRQLGFIWAAKEATRNDLHGPGKWGKNDYLMDRVKCQGYEVNLVECSHVGISTCSGKSAGVSCLYNKGCSYGWLSFNGACYQLNVKAMDFKSAESVCQKKGAKLAYILQPSENNFLSNMIYTKFKDLTKVWIGGYYSDIKLDSGQTISRWNWYNTIHNVNQWNTSNLWFQGFGDFKSDKRPQGDLKSKSCIALNRIYTDSLLSDNPYDVNYFWWDNLSCKEKLPFICQMNIPRGRTNCYEGTGLGYLGSMSRTNQGTVCAKWSHPAAVVNSNTHPNAGLGDHNYCRNPDNDIMPWCYINPEAGIYGYCALEKCSEIPVSQVTTKRPNLDPPGFGKGGCAENKFYCPSMEGYKRQCLSSKRICDKISDCSGLEDEDPTFCKSFFCSENEFFCSTDMFCILKSHVCDGKRNCADGSDERNCTSIDEIQILEKFDKYDSQIMISKENISYMNIPIQRCMDNCRIMYPQFQCRSFNFLPPNETRVYSECHLMKTLFFETPNMISNIIYPGAYYSFKLDCKDNYKCTSGMCIPMKNKCDGRNDCGDNSDESQCDTVTFPSFEIRLTGSKNDWEGKIQIRYEGEWGYVCDDKFDIKTAHVICKQLGFIEAINFIHGAGSKFGKVKNPNILLDEINCVGTELSLENCPHDTWRKHNCKSEEIAGLICKVDRACLISEYRCQKDKFCIGMNQVCDGKNDCSDGSDEPEGKCNLRVKLLNGPDSSSGRVEIIGAFSKGSICRDKFDDNDATVICRMLGISGRAEAVLDGRFGEGTGEIILSNLNCNGSERSLLMCSPFNWGEHRCSHKDDVGVICGITSLKQEITTKAPTNKTAQVPGISCGRKPITQKRGRVVGGFETIYGAFPWQVGIRRVSDNYDLHWCGATILSEDWIISASHCYERPKNEYIVRTGDWNNNELDTYEQSFQIEELLLNPKYTGPPQFDFDLALIKIKRNNGIGIIFNNYVQPACLPNVGDVPDVRTKCFISGWGDTQTVTAERLLAAEVPLVKAERCSEFYKGRITERMQCAGYEAGGIDTCQGDSGGPLVCQVNGIYTIFGATSWGDGCALPKSPGVYANIRVMLDWVKENTGF